MAIFIFKIFKNGGIKGAIIGSKVREKVGVVTGTGSSLMNVSLKVHELYGSEEKTVALELVAKSFLSYQMMSITLSNTEAKKLIQLISDATDDRTSLH
ncbi:hypothetical protein NF212_06595 [Parasalinivibrio latis]|uniref:hypothetical protein n=1 Tax=Parasalinivibrio latis TaxID=2952610 RepID=UPI0030E4DAF7